MVALAKIQSAGFTLSLAVNGGLKVEPFSKLSDAQLVYLKNHKPEIIAELKAANEELSPIAKLTNTERQSIAKWVRSLGGSEVEIQEETAAVLKQCEDEAEARLYYLNRAAEVLDAKDNAQYNDTRRYCRQCLNFTQSSYCSVKNTRMLDDLPRHCGDFNDNGKLAPTIGLFKGFNNNANS